MAPPIFSSTPATPRSDEKTAKARTTNNKQITTVSAFRLIRLLHRIYGAFVSAATARFCGGSVIASTLLLSRKETTPLRRNQMPCASSHAASASTDDPSFILMIACSPLATVLPPVAIGPLLSAAGGAVVVAGATGLASGLASASAGLSAGDAVSAGANWLLGTTAT